MGTIEDIMLDINSGKVEYVVIKFGGFLTINEKYFAIPWKLLTVDPAKKAFILNQSKEMLEKAPGFDMSHWPETNFHAEDELAASTVNLKVYFWVTTKGFRRGTLQTRGRLIQKVKTKLEENGFNLPANITELKFYDASNPISVMSKQDESKRQ